MTTENNTPNKTDNSSNGLNESKEAFSSDYEAEWALESDNPKLDDKAVDHNDNANKSTDEEPAPNPVAQAVTPSPTPNEDPNKAAEPEQEDVIAGMSEKQLEAYRKAERDAKAMKGRHRLAQDRIADLETKLANEQKAKAEAEKLARKPTEFEQNHPEYYQELQKEFGTNKGDSAPQKDMEKEFYSEADLILSAHPDAGDVYNSSEFKTWLVSQPAHVQQRIESSSAQDVIPILDAYQSASAASAQESLRDIADVGGSKGQPNLRNKSNMSDAEKYELEWESDDL